MGNNATVIKKLIIKKKIVFSDWIRHLKEDFAWAVAFVFLLHQNLLNMKFLEDEVCMQGGGESDQGNFELPIEESLKNSPK